MVKDDPNHIPMNIIGSSHTSRKILEEGDIILFPVVLITPKSLRYNRSPSVLHYPPSARSFVPYVYDRTFSASVQHYLTRLELISWLFFVIYVIKINVNQKCCNIICHGNNSIHRFNIIKKILQCQMIFLELTVLY